MTRADFLLLLSHRRGWSLTPAGELRLGPLCPLMALSPVSSTGPLESGDFLGLRRAETCDLMEAADNRGDPFLREDMLRAAGVL